MRNIFFVNKKFYDNRDLIVIFFNRLFVLGDYHIEKY